MKVQVYNSYVNHLYFVLNFLDNTETAILLYKKGIRELEKAVNVYIDPSSEYLAMKGLLENTNSIHR